MERIKARIYILFYTLFASLPLLLTIIIITQKNCSRSIFFLRLRINRIYSIPILTIFSATAFLVKFPIYLVHQWLPKAHVEAPVGGSIILAGILLKLGGYGIIRILFLLKTVSVFYFIVLFSLFGGRLLRVMCLINRDIKVLIAYSSVVHISLSISNLFSKNF